MKHRARSWAGKTLLYFLTVILACLAAACLIGTIAITEISLSDSVWYDLEQFAWGNLYFWLYKNRVLIPIVGGVSALGALASFIAQMCVAGRRPYSDELYPGPMQIVPSDIMLAGAVLVLVLASQLLLEMTIGSAAADVVLLVLLMIGGITFFIALCLNIAGHVKKGDLIRSSVTYRVLNGLWRVVRFLFRTLPLTWKVLIGFGALSLVELIFVLMSGNLGLWWFLEKLILTPVLLWIVVQMRRLQKGGEAIATGDTGYQVKTEHMLPVFRQHGEDLNHVALGMQNAIDKQLKSERMRTELITNVSHDIKTPLTSIINYTDLISREETDNENIKEYTEVLTRQSTRLKRLIEDLVEASKASTGNLEVELVPTQAKVLLSQAAGEYEERFEQLGLEPVLKIPEEEVRLLADGRRMWRIFDNLLNNICKYSQTGTRVYITLQKEAENVVFSFMNISKEPLGISADELKERFVRGDVSRNTEGSGLGLSIAESLAKLQNGQLDLQIEGDLFKAILTFPALP